MTIDAHWSFLDAAPALRHKWLTLTEAGDLLKPLVGEKHWRETLLSGIEGGEFQLRRSTANGGTLPLPAVPTPILHLTVADFDWSASQVLPNRIGISHEQFGVRVKRVNLHDPESHPQPDIKPGPKSTGGIKQLVDEAVRAMVTAGRLDPKKHGVKAAAARLLQPLFRNYDAETLSKYAATTLNELKKKTGRVSGK